MAKTLREENEELKAGLRRILVGNDSGHPLTYHGNDSPSSCRIQDCYCLEEFIEELLEGCD